MKQNPFGYLSTSVLAGPVLALFLGLVSRTTADASWDAPIPEAFREHSRAEQQRIRYLNRTLSDLPQPQVVLEDVPGEEQIPEQDVAIDLDKNRFRVLAINVLHNLGFQERAREMLDDLLALYPDDYTLLLKRAFIHLREEEWAAAAVDFEGFSAAAPGGHPYIEDVIQRRAEIAFGLQRLDEAADLMRGLLAVNATAMRRAFMAELAIEQEQWEEAVTELRTALQLTESPEEQALLQLKLGYALFEIGQQSEAEDALDAAAQIYISYEEHAIEQEQWEETVTELRAAQHFIDPPELQALLNLTLGYALFNLEFYPEADAALVEAETFFDSPPELLDILRHRAIAAFQTEQYEASAQFYRHFLEHGHDPDAALNLHYALRRRSEELRDEGLPDDELLDESIPLLASIIEDSEAPRSLLHAATYELARIRYQQQQVDEAIEMLLEMTADFDIAVDIRHPATLKLARIRLEQMEWGAAVDLLQELISEAVIEDELRRTAQYKLARAYLARGQYWDYLAQLQSLIEEVPESRHIEEYESYRDGMRWHERVVVYLYTNFTALFTPFVTLAMLVVVLYCIWRANCGKIAYVRRIPGVTAMEEAVGRATEMGRPVLFVMGYSTIQMIETVNALAVLSHMAQLAARMRTKMVTMIAMPDVYPMAEATLRQAYMNEGAPELFHPQEQLRFLSNDHVVYAAGVSRFVEEENPGCVVFFGTYNFTALLLSEPGARLGVMQIAGEPSLFQMPFFVCTCDHTIIGEEYYAAGAFVNPDPRMRNGLLSQDLIKLFFIIIMIIALAMLIFWPDHWLLSALARYRD